MGRRGRIGPAPSHPPPRPRQLWPISARKPPPLCAPRPGSWQPRPGRGGPAHGAAPGGGAQVEPANPHARSRLLAARIPADSRRPQEVRPDSQPGAVVTCWGLSGRPRSGPLGSEGPGECGTQLRSSSWGLGEGRGFLQGNCFPTPTPAPPTVTPRTRRPPLRKGPRAVRGRPPATSSFCGKSLPVMKSCGLHAVKHAGMPSAGPGPETKDGWMERPKKPYHTLFKGSDKASPLSETGETTPNPAPGLAPARSEEFGLGLPSYPR